MIFTLHCNCYGYWLKINVSSINILLIFSFTGLLFSIVLYSFYFWIFLFFILYLIILFWCNDLWIESALSLTKIEQFSFIIGIKLLLLTELMIFFTCFWCLINFRFLSNSFSLFYSLIYSINSMFCKFFIFLWARFIRK